MLHGDGTRIPGRARRAAFLRFVELNFLLLANTHMSIGPMLELV